MTVRPNKIAERKAYENMVRWFQNWRKDNPPTDEEE